MNKLLICLSLTVCFLSCKNKKSDSTKIYFSIVDYLKAEVKKMDTLPLHFNKIITVDSTSDTIALTKKEFRQYAKEFFDIPDIASADKMDDYTETSDFDEILNNVLLMYTAKKQDGEVRNETIMMQPDDQGNTQVKTILATTITTDKDSTVEKNMTWHIDKRLQIVKKVSKNNQPEKISAVIVNWE
jgi:hypothetical protein